MENNKTNKGLVWLVVILIILVIGLMGFIIYKEFFVNNNLSNENDLNKTTTTTEQINIKIDENKDWVYDAKYVPNVKQQTYTAWDETYNVNDYKAPYININSTYAKTINNEIKKIYDSAMQVFNNGIEDEMSYIDTFKYNYYLKKNILSIVLTTGYGGTDVVYPDYHIFNIDIDNGNEITFENILNYKNITETNFDDKAKNAIIEEYDTFYKDINKTDDLYVEYYESLKQQTLEDYNNDKDKKCYIDNNGNLNLLATISFPAGREYADKLIAIK